MENKSPIIQVLLPLALVQPYSYQLAPGMVVAPGDFVRVPLANRELVGVVWAMGGSAPGKAKLKAVIEKLPLPPLGDLQRRFMDWVAQYYLEPPGSILRLALRTPSVFSPAPEKTAFGLGENQPDKMTPQRQRVLDLLADGLVLSASEIREMSGVGASVIKGLLQQGALREVLLPALKAFQQPDAEKPGFNLSASQQAAADHLTAMIEKSGAQVGLIDGVTGSGKTEVYFEAMAAALRKGGQVLLLLPEIALTQGFMARVEERFGAQAGAWHSELRPRERERVWRGVADGSAKLVLGARSALFLPWHHLQLIVVDEEHENAFKQEEGANYHARDMAIVYGALGKFPVVLASATPSLESLVNVDRGRFDHLRLENRHGAAELPEIQLIDMKAEGLKAGQWLSHRLIHAVEETLGRDEQVLLFLNRRGYAPLTLCRTCGHRLHCPQCAAALVEHRFRRQMICHHCGHSEPSPSQCPGCGGEDSLVPCGPGVERLAEEARERFPEARIALLSSDLLRGQSLRETLNAVGRGEYNLIIGTQLVAKGHHFPNLTLAGVVDADLALESGDPRAGERSFAMLAQVSGRAGRGEKPGKALIQTYVPDHPVFSALARGDREAFLAHEKHMREQAGLPPYGRLVGVIISGGQAQETENFARKLAQIAPQTRDVELLGPAPAPIQVIRGRHRWRFLIKAPRNVDVQAYLQAWLGDVKARGALRIDVDVDPYSFL